MHANNIRLRVIGDRARLSKDIIGLIENAEALTRDNRKLTLVVALGYGSRQEITLAELARLAGMGQDSFARRFRATTGLAPYAYVIEQRMRRAEELLAKGDLDLARIACALGFSSQSHFTTTFRRQRGLTPLAYRRQRFS